MPKKTMVSFRLNGYDTDVVVEPRELLIHTLREKCAHTGPHIGCETTHCGACTVDMNGMSVKSCTVLTVQAEGREVLTIEGIAALGEAPARQGDAADLWSGCGAISTIFACAWGERRKTTWAIRGSSRSLTYWPRPCMSRSRLGRGTVLPM